jgi:hypothetical protein
MRPCGSGLASTARLDLGCASVYRGLRRPPCGPSAERLHRRQPWWRGRDSRPGDRGLPWLRDWARLSLDPSGGRLRSSAGWAGIFGGDTSGDGPTPRENLETPAGPETDEARAAGSCPPSTSVIDARAWSGPTCAFAWQAIADRWPPRKRLLVRSGCWSRPSLNWRSPPR